MSELVGATWVKLGSALGLLAIFAGLLFAAWWALYSDRSRGRRRCPRCWHDLSFSPGMTCGECGHAAKAEREFMRTRRRPGAFLLSVLGCTLVGVYAIDHLNSEGWLSYVPTPVLVGVYPHAGRSGWVARELTFRIRGNEFDEDHWLSLLRRCARGDGDARPPSDAWTDKYATFASLAAQQAPSLTDDSLRDEAMDHVLSIACSKPPEVTFATRERWPAGSTAALHVYVDDWWRNPAHLRILAAPRLEGSEPTAHVCRDAPIQPRSYTLHLPPLESGEHDVEIDLMFERRKGYDEPWVPAGETTVPVPLVIDEGSARTLEPVSGEGIDNAIRATFTRGLSQWTDGSLPVRVGIRTRPTFGSRFDDTAIAVEIEVLRNGRVGRRLDIWWRGGFGNIERQHAWEVPYWDDEILGAPATANDEWAVRVTGSPRLALRVEGVTKYWDGQFSAPVNVQHRRGSAPPRGWIVDDEVEGR